MKFNVVLPLAFILCSAVAYADTPVAKDSQQTCENRINALKKSLQNAIDKKQNAEEAKQQLDQINSLPASLTPCEKQRQIPMFSDDSLMQKTNEMQKDKKISH